MIFMRYFETPLIHINFLYLSDQLPWSGLISDKALQHIVELLAGTCGHSEAMKLSRSEDLSTHVESIIEESLQVPLQRILVILEPFNLLQRFFNDGIAL